MWRPRWTCGRLTSPLGRLPDDRSLALRAGPRTRGEPMSVPESEAPLPAGMYSAISDLITAAMAVGLERGASRFAHPGTQRPPDWESLSVARAELERVIRAHLPRPKPPSCKCVGYAADGRVDIDRSECPDHGPLPSASP